MWFYIPPEGLTTARGIRCAWLKSCKDPESPFVDCCCIYIYIIALSVLKYLNKCIYLFICSRLTMLFSLVRQPSFSSQAWYRDRYLWSESATFCWVISLNPGAVEALTGSWCVIFTVCWVTSTCDRGRPSWEFFTRWPWNLKRDELFEKPSTGCQGSNLPSVPLL